MSRAKCLPVAPDARRIEVVEVWYTTGKGSNADPMHRHRAFYSLDGDLLMEKCYLAPEGP